MKQAMETFALTTYRGRLAVLVFIQLRVALMPAMFQTFRYYIMLVKNTVENIMEIWVRKLFNSVSFIHVQAYL